MDFQGGVDPPTTPNPNTVVTLAQRRTEELRRAQVGVGAGVRVGLRLGLEFGVMSVI